MYKSWHPSPLFSNRCRPHNRIRNGTTHLWLVSDQTYEISGSSKPCTKVVVAPTACAFWNFNRILLRKKTPCSTLQNFKVPVVCRTKDLHIEQCHNTEWSMVYNFGRQRSQTVVKTGLQRNNILSNFPIEPSYHFWKVVLHSPNLKCGTSCIYVCIWHIQTHTV